MTRTADEIQSIEIQPLEEPVHVVMKYKDGKQVNFGVDRGNFNELEVLEEIVRCIKLQLESKQNG